MKAFERIYEVAINLGACYVVPHWVVPQASQYERWVALMLTLLVLNTGWLLNTLRRSYGAR